MSIEKFLVNLGWNKLKVSVLVVILLSLVMSTSVLAQSVQPFELQESEVYADCSAESIVKAQDGGFVIVGNNYTDTSTGPSLMKINNTEGVEWIKTYPEIKGGLPELQVVSSGYVLSTGSGWLKTDFQGNIEWSKKFDLPHERSFIPFVFLEEDGSYVMFKSGYSVGRNYYGIYKYGVDDVLLWNKFIGEAYVGDILLSSSGDGYFVAGGQDQKLWFTKLDLAGEVVWSRTYNYKTLGTMRPYFGSVIETLDGGFLLSGCNDRDSWVVKTDRNGREQWHRQYDRYSLLGEDFLYNYDCPVRDVVQDNDGRYLVFRGMEVIALDSRGNELWVESYFEHDSAFEGLGAVGVERVSGIVSDNDGHLVVAVTYRTAPYPDKYPGSFEGPSSLWVASFALEPNHTSDSNVLLFGVVCVVVVGVFVGCLVYLKWYRCRRMGVG